MIKILKNGVKSKGYMMKCDFDFNKKEIWKKEKRWRIVESFNR